MDSLFKNACNNNIKDVINYFMDDKLIHSYIDADTFYKLCQHGNFEAVKYCILRVKIKYSVALTHAYKSNNVDIVSLLLKHNKDEIIDFIPHFIYLLKNNQLDIIKIILNKSDIYINKKLLELFCKFNNYFAVELLLSRLANMINFTNQFASLSDSEIDPKILNLLLNNDYIIINLVSALFMKENFMNFQFLLSKLNHQIDFGSKFKYLCKKYKQQNKCVMNDIKCIIDCPNLVINLNSLYDPYFHESIKLFLIDNYFELIKDKLDYSSYFCMCCPNLNVQKRVIKEDGIIVDPIFIRFLVITQSPIYLLLCSKKIKLCSDVLRILNSMIY